VIGYMAWLVRRPAEGFHWVGEEAVGGSGDEAPWHEIFVGGDHGTYTQSSRGEEREFVGASFRGRLGTAAWIQLLDVKEEATKQERKKTAKHGKHGTSYSV
jgi:hypothetical protein